MSKPIPGTRPAEGRPDSSSANPTEKGHGQRVEAARRQREAAALRENLAKRKAQQRSRRPSAAGGTPGDGSETR